MKAEPTTTVRAGPWVAAVSLLTNGGSKPRKAFMASVGSTRTTACGLPRGTPIT
jgi:hypothetical protein